ncbi:MAG: hypothetical protein ACYDAJ_08405 [Nitrosotalea sp.]
MKILHYSIITGSGISVVLAVGIYLIVFPSVVFSTWNFESTNNILESHYLKLSK